MTGKGVPHRYVRRMKAPPPVALPKAERLNHAAPVNKVKLAPLGFQDRRLPGEGKLW